MVQAANKRLVTEASPLLASKIARDTITMLASDHGVVGDGVADDGPALNTLLTSAAAAGREVSLTPGSTVLCSTVTITPPSGTRLNLNGATIKSALPGVNDRLITITGKSNVKIYGGTLDGNKASFAPVTEFRHNIHITNSSAITVRDVLTKNAKGDGVFVGDGISGFSSDIVLDRVTADGNHRQGLSIATVKGFAALACRFVNTSGTSPQCGVDIEPDADTEPVERVRFVGCEFSGNAGSGVQVSCRVTPTVRQEGIDFVGCTIHDNMQEGVILVCGRKVRFTGGEITGNSNHGVWFSSAAGTMDDVSFTSVAITKNAKQGILTDVGFNRLAIIGCTVTENGQTVASIGIDLGTAVASVGARIVGTTSGGAPQTYGLRTNANLSQLTLVGNSYAGNTTGAVSLGDAIATRVRMDQTGFDSAAAVGFAAKVTYTQAYGNTALGLRYTGNTVDTLAARTDGALTWSSGTAAQDTILSRLAAGVLGLGVGQAFRSGTTTTAARPTASSVGAGSQMYDTTLSKPICSDGTVWRDAAGTAV